MRYFLVLTVFTLFSTTAFSQARSGIGFAIYVNKPFSNNDYSIGGGSDIQGSIALSDKWALVPAIGLENMKGSGRAIYDGPDNYATRHIDNIGLIYAGLSGKYFFKNNLFARLGSMLFIGAGSGDISAGGIGGSAGAGYSLKADRHSSFEFSLNTDIVYIEHSPGTVPIVSLKLAYMFNFKGKD
ncbi:hypothetical protein [Mucilaginibacter sp.]|jgi:hypothetical protein|uniref:hypothetical protein n=1 Tax=Mucilaginibacter sp. TaxID=1882438 RepID=UPI002C165131|nr:hypothetical protein [Mucilaginibacter sp.]HTI59259.1 hypothetical protein [Mucilaginibacter sp.]